MKIEAQHAKDAILVFAAIGAVATFYVGFSGGIPNNEFETRILEMLLVYALIVLVAAGLVLLVDVSMRTGKDWKRLVLPVMSSFFFPFVAFFLWMIAPLLFFAAIVLVPVVAVYWIGKFLIKKTKQKV